MRALNKRFKTRDKFKDKLIKEYPNEDQAGKWRTT